MCEKSLKLILSGFLLLNCLISYSQPVSVPATTVSSNGGHTITVVAQPRQVDLPGLFKWTFTIHNATQKTIKIRDFRLESVEAPTPLVVDRACLSESVQKSIGSNDFHTITCTVSTPNYQDTFSSFLVSMTSRWSLLTLAANEYQFVATANASTTNAEEETIYISTSKAIPVRLTPTVWQSILGAMLGSLLMVIFWLSSPKVQSQVGVSSAGIDGPLHILKTLGRAVALWSGSTTAAAISIFLTFRMKDASLPFTLSVNDFYGGLVVGLFGVVLTNWLGPKLFDKGGDIAPGSPDMAIPEVRRLPNSANKVRKGDDKG